MMEWEWEEIEGEPEYDLTPFVVQEGADIPVWFWNALVRGDVRLDPEPEVGEENWCRPVVVRATGERFPIGSFMQKGDLFWHSI